jgi:hypothetical protein
MIIIANSWIQKRYISLLHPVYNQQTTLIITHVFLFFGFKEKMGGGQFIRW